MGEVAQGTEPLRWMPEDGVLISLGIGAILSMFRFVEESVGRVNQLEGETIATATELVFPMVGVTAAALVIGRVPQPPLLLPWQQCNSWATTDRHCSSLPHTSRQTLLTAASAAATAV